MKDKENIWIDNPMEFAQNRIDSRQYILLPKIAEMIALDGVKSVLDYGCGEGFLAKHIQNKQTNLGLFDINATMVDLAKRNAEESEITKLNIYKNSNEIPSSLYETVVLSLVLMTIGDENEYMNVLNNCNKALSKDGSLIIGITHPCFRQALYSTHHTKFSLGNEFDYFNNQAPFDVFLRTSKSEKYIQFEDFHHNLTYTFSKIKEAGFYVEDFIELQDMSIENSYFNHHYSPYLIIKCKSK